jgi:hypothetical protein
MSELLTVRDVAQVMKCSEDKVIRVFARMHGVIDLGRPENLARRRYPGVAIGSYGFRSRSSSDI